MEGVKASDREEICLEYRSRIFGKEELVVSSLPVPDSKYLDTSYLNSVNPS